MSSRNMNREAIHAPESANLGFSSLKLAVPSGTAFFLWPNPHPWHSRAEWSALFGDTGEMPSPPAPPMPVVDGLAEAIRMSCPDP